MSQQYHNKKALAKAVSDAAAASSTDNLSRGVERYTTLTERLSASTFGIGVCQIVTATYSILSVSDSLEWFSYGESPLLASRPTAVLFGKGQWQVGTAIYISNGTSWELSEAKIGLTYLYIPDEKVISTTNNFVTTSNLSLERTIRASGAL